MSSKKYRVNEIFYSIQGEGMRAGTANVFIRFSGCNMNCHEGHEEENADFNCDTEFVSGVWMTASDILRRLKDEVGRTDARRQPSIIFTGGEPGIQLDKYLVSFFQNKGFYCAIESNGTVDLSPLGLDWVTISPKVAEHALKAKTADEVKYVRHYGQGIPKPSVKTLNKLISPAFQGKSMDPRAVEWCHSLVLDNPSWRLSLQTHKWIGVR